MIERVDYFRGKISLIEFENLNSSIGSCKYNINPLVVWCYITVYVVENRTFLGLNFVLIGVYIRTNSLNSISNWHWSIIMRLHNGPIIVFLFLV